MKTVAKKTVKKLAIKVATKVATKAAAKAAAKGAVKVAKPVLKKAAKPAVKAPVKAVKKPLAKLAKPTKPTKPTKPSKLAKPAPKAITQKPIKAAAKLLTKSAAKSDIKGKVVIPAKAAKVVKTSALAAKKLVKKVEIPEVKIKTSKSSKPIKPLEAEKIVKDVNTVKSAKTKAESKPTKAESKSNQPMVIASKSAPTEHKITAKPTANEAAAPAAPVLSKARTSRLASLTVPSMAQSVASTAAKSSYGPAVHAEVFVIPPPFAPKQNLKLANNWKNKTAEEMSDEELLAMPESEYMNIKQMMYFRLKLIELKKGILESAGATTEHLRDESAVVPDPTDRATIEEEHALELRTRDRERKLLKKIEQSIVRIDAGDYGYCDETGEAIGVGRLLARPTATLSLEAQQRRELKQKMFGD